MADRFMTVTDDVRYSDKAQWVVMPGAARQQWVMYRSHFATKAGNRVLLLISAAEYCVIYLNGMLVSRSFLRSYIYDKAYEVYDVSSAVTDGDNVIAVHACESGEKERCGILCEVKDGDDEVRTEWVCRADDSIKAPCAYMASSASYEAVDMSLMCDGWQEPGYDDSEWQMAESLGGVGRYPFEKMHQSKKEPQTNTPVRPDKTAYTDKFIARNSVSIRLSSAPKCDSVYFAGLTADILSHMYIVIGAGVNDICFDGNRIGKNECVSVSAGRHTVSLLSMGGAPELTFVIDGKLTVGDWNAFDIAQPKLPFAYPWNEPRRARAVPDELSRCLLSPAGFVAVSHPVAVTPADMYHTLTTGNFTEKSQTASENIILRRGERATYFFDTERIGLISLDFSAQHGERLIVMSYEMDSGGKIRYMSRYNMSEVTSRGGRQTWTSVRRRGFRYVAVYAPDGEVTLHSASVIVTRCNAEPAGAFRCDDGRMNDIYDMCIKTAQSCMMDMYVDCPGYEQNVWVGDAGITALVNMVNFGKGAFDAEYLRTIGLSMNDGLERFYRTGNPRYVAKKYLPCSCFPTYPEGGIPIWSYTYVMQVMDHYLYFGADEYIDDFVADIDLCLRRSIELTDDRGLLSVDGAWNLIEWADNDLDMCGEVTANNCMLAACFARASDFVSSLGMSERANEYAAYAEKYRVSVNKYCYDEKEGAYVDTVRDEYTYRHYLDVYAQKGRTPLKYDEYLAHSRISVQTNAFAVLYGCADGERRDNALKIVKTAVDKGGFVIGTPANVTADKSLYGAGRAVTIGTPFFLYYAIDCLIKCGEFDLAVKSVKRDWGVFLDDGFDTCLEGFRTRSGELARSASHAWGASPAVFLMRDILGIRPTKAGYGEFTVTPHLGDLKFAQGSVPTPYGPISVRCTKTDSGTDISVEAPDKCKYVR